MNREEKLAENIVASKQKLGSALLREDEEVQKGVRKDEREKKHKDKVDSIKDKKRAKKQKEKDQRKQEKAEKAKMLEEHIPRPTR